jgi:2'-hydroxyisoflavone reductase
MIVPGAPSDPLQLIDVRDLADWLIHCLEDNVAGVYNATGPAKLMTMKAMVESVRTGVGSEATFTWLDNAFLAAQGVREGQFPLYEPPVGETAGFHRCNITRALGKGLTFRPMADTAKATLEWYRSLPATIQAGVAPQFANRANEPAWIDTEKALLAKWKQK